MSKHNKHDWRKAIIDAVRAKMNADGYTQMDVARQTGLSQPYISQILSGGRKSTNIETMMLLAKWAKMETRITIGTTT